MHTHFPHIVDGQPIDAERLVTEAGFALRDSHKVISVAGLARVQLKLEKPKSGGPGYNQIESLFCAYFLSQDERFDLVTMRVAILVAAVGVP